MRVKQKAYLGRYMRASVRDWDDVEVSEVERYFEATSDIIRGENKKTQLEET